MRKQGGFTLLEIMLSLMIVGLIASVAGSAIVAGLNGYLAAKDNQSLAQKSQLAMLRVSRHLAEFVNIPNQSTSARSDSIIIEGLSPTSGSTLRTFAIGLDGSQLKIAEDGRGTSPDYHNGDVLVDGVSSFALTYYRDGAPWSPAGDPLQRLATIQVDLVMVRPDGVTRPFVTQVHPRNINSLGGQPTPVTPPDQANYASCFVATAAYGRADHPMVLYLREFRDRYLLTWEGGKTLVHVYYSVGPALASLIQGRPWACGLAQFLLLPFVIFSVFALYFPLGIPITLFALWALYRKSHHNTLCRKGVPAMLSNQRGAVLVAVVITMIIFASLGAMMLSFFTTSTFSQLGGSKGMKTFYLAESGLRYAASQYMNAADEAARETVLEGMHNDTFSLASEGQFNLQVYPYWYQTTALPAGTNLQAKVFGGLPLDAGQYKANSWIQIIKPDKNVQYEQISSVILSPPSGITFVKTGAWLESYPVGSTIYPVALGVGSSQTFNANQAGSFISLQADSGYDIFLPRNGVFTVQEQGSTAMRTLGYDEVYVSGGYCQLRGIRDPNIAPGTTQAVTIPADSRLVLSKGIRLRSTGILSAGSATETRRVVTYLLPIGNVWGGVNPKTDTPDLSESMANWFNDTHVSHIGTHEIKALTYDTGSALHMKSASSFEYEAGSYNCWTVRESQLGFNWSGAGVRLDQEWARAGHFLSYDLQTKMYFDISSTGYTKYANGLNFRLDNEGNTYGLSFNCHESGINAQMCDGIPDAIYASALSHGPGLTLWRKTYPVREYFGPDKVVAPASATTPPAPSLAIITTDINWQGMSSYGDRVRFETTGTLPSPLIEGKDYYVRRVTYDGTYYLYVFDPTCPYTGWTNLVTITSSGTGTHSITKMDPQYVQLAKKQTRDDWVSGSAKYDYYHLNQTLTGDTMRKWITVLVRLKEAPSVTFTNGGNANLQRIKVGDIVYQGSESSPTAIAKVSREPVYRYSTSKTWNGTAQGALILDVVKDSGGSVRPYTFSTGSLYVGGAALATVSEFRPKDNWVQVFVGDPNDVNPLLSAANTTPWDPNTSYKYINRNEYDRSTKKWPPDDILRGGTTTIDPSNDYYTLASFAVSTGETSITGFLSETNPNSSEYDMLRIRETSAPFVTPDSGTFPTDRPEVGVHAYGDMTTYTYFDDFHIQFGESAGGAQQGFLQPIQY